MISHGTRKKYNTFTYFLFSDLFISDKYQCRSTERINSINEGPQRESRVLMRVQPRGNQGVNKGGAEGIQGINEGLAKGVQQRVCRRAMRIQQKLRKLTIAYNTTTPQVVNQLVFLSFLLTRLGIKCEQVNLL